jgi:FtsH-binding integral membrane protein
VLSKILLALLVFLLASKYGLRTKLKNLKPQLDRAVNVVIVGLIVIYVVQLISWLVQRRGY